MLTTAIIIALALLFTGFILGEYQRVAFNDGICEKCGCPLQLQESKKDGTRRYVCPECGRTVFVSSFNPEKEKNKQ